MAVSYIKTTPAQPSEAGSYQSAFALTANEIYKTLANMIISQEVFADNIGKNQTLVDKARVDGGLYGDTKLYYATDVLFSSE